MFKRQTQICVFLENRHGRFKEFCDQLYEAGVDILAMNLHADHEVGIIRMVVDKTEKAIASLKEEGYPYLLTEVLAVEVPNKSGMAAGVGHRFAEAEINIEYTYFSASGVADTPALMIFKVADLDHAMAKLQASSKIYN